MRGCKQFVSGMAQLAPSCTLLLGAHIFGFFGWRNAMMTQAHEAFGVSIQKGCKRVQGCKRSDLNQQLGHQRGVPWVKRVGSPPVWAIRSLTGPQFRMNSECQSYS